VHDKAQGSGGAQVQAQDEAAEEEEAGRHQHVLAAPVPVHGPAEETRAHVLPSRAIYNKLVSRSLDECAPYTDEESGRSVVAMLEELQRKYRAITQASNLHHFFRKKKSRAWYGAVNQEVRDSTFRDFIKAVRSSCALYLALREKGNDMTYPVLSFKSKFARLDTIELLTRDFTVMNTGVRFHQTFFEFKGNESIMFKEKKLPPLKNSVRLQRLREGQYYLVIPRRQEWRQSTERRVCAIDPSVRNFVVINDPDGRTVSVKDAFAVIKRRFDATDKMKSTLAKMDNEGSAEHFHQEMADAAGMHRALPIGVLSPRRPASLDCFRVIRFW